MAALAMMIAPTAAAMPVAVGRAPPRCIRPETTLWPADADAAVAWASSGYLATEPEAKPPEGEQTTMDFDPDGDDGK